MIRVLVMANDSLLADGIVSMLTEEINLDVVRLTHRELGKGDHHSVVIVVDEGERENESIKVFHLFRDRANLIVIMISLKSRDIYIYESYQLVNPEMEQVIHIIREFSKMNLKKNPDDRRRTQTGMLSFKEVAALFYSFFLHFIRRKSVSNVTPLIGSGRSAGFDI